MKILVTGGAGFLGREIVRQLLARDCQVRSFQRSPAPELEGLGVEVVRGDLGAADTSPIRSACEGCDAVFHVAAKAGVWGPADVYERINILGTKQVVDAARSAAVPQLILTSTPSVVFHGGAIELGDESLPYGRNWIGDYARTKAAAEEAALAADNVAGLRVTALRPHLILGPGDPHLLPRVLDRARRNRLIQVGDGTNEVDFTWVEDAARAHLLAWNRLREEPDRIGGRAFFITQGEPVRLWPWVEELVQRLEYQGIRREVSLPSARKVASGLEAVWQTLRLRGEPPLTRFAAVELAKTHTFAIDAARRDLGYEPTLTMREIQDRLVALEKEKRRA
jgi:nucleoside-diphosphate-sugar epimerase